MSAKKAKPAETAVAQEAIPAPTPRLLERYEKEILPALAEKLGRSNRLSLPQIGEDRHQHGCGQSHRARRNIMEEAVDAMKQIAGQKPIITLSRKSIANFKLREGMPIGCKVTLRGKRM